MDIENLTELLDSSEFMNKDVVLGKVELGECTLGESAKLTNRSQLLKTYRIRRSHLKGPETSKYRELALATDEFCKNLELLSEDDEIFGFMLAVNGLEYFIIYIDNPKMIIGCLPFQPWP